jgi:hypothetical protein
MEQVFKKNNQIFKVAGDIRGMSRRAPFLSFWVVAWNLYLYIPFFLMLIRSLTQHLCSEYSLCKCCKLI